MFPSFTKAGLSLCLQQATEAPQKYQFYYDVGLIYFHWVL